MTTNTNNPFRPAGQVAKRLKLYVYGESGVGKTFLGLSFPKAAVVDTEGGTDFYAGREGIEPFMVLPEKDVMKIHQALDWIEQDKGKNIQTLVIDPITVLWSVLQEAGLQAAQARARRNNRSTEDVSLTQKDWGVIKREWNRLMTRLVNLPCHVIITAREKDIVEQRGTEIITIGKRGDTEKSTPYLADVTVRMTTQKDKAGQLKRVGIIEKDRTGYFQLGQQIENLNFLHFAPALGQQSATAPIAQQRTEEEAAAGSVGLFDETVANNPGKNQDEDAQLFFSDALGAYSEVAAMEQLDNLAEQVKRNKNRLSKEQVDELLAAHAFAKKRIRTAAANVIAEVMPA